MTTKRAARLIYYAGIRKAMLKHIETTEKSIRKLPGLSEAEQDKIVASVHKRHLKLLQQIDEDMAKDMRTAKQVDAA